MNKLHNHNSAIRAIAMSLKQIDLKGGGEGLREGGGSPSLVQCHRWL